MRILGQTVYCDGKKLKRAIDVIEGSVSEGFATIDGQRWFCVIEWPERKYWTAMLPVEPQTKMTTKMCRCCGASELVPRQGFGHGSRCSCDPHFCDIHGKCCWHDAARHNPEDLLSETFTFLDHGRTYRGSSDGKVLGR